MKSRFSIALVLVFLFASICGLLHHRLAGQPEVLESKSGESHAFIRVPKAILMSSNLPPRQSVSRSDGPRAPRFPQSHQDIPPESHFTSPAEIPGVAAKEPSLASTIPFSPKPELVDPWARFALKSVGMDEEATAYWLGAINDPSLPPDERQDLIAMADGLTKQ